MQRFRLQVGLIVGVFAAATATMSPARLCAQTSGVTLQGTWPTEAFVRDGSGVHIRSDFEALEFYPFNGPDGEYRQWIDPENPLNDDSYLPGAAEYWVSNLQGELLPTKFRVAPPEWCLSTIFNFPDFGVVECIGSDIQLALAENDFTDILFAPYSPFPVEPANDFWAPAFDTRAFHADAASGIFRRSRFFNYDTGEFEPTNLRELYNSAIVSVGRNSLLDPISVPPNPGDAANYFDILSYRQEALLSLPYRLVQLGEPPQGVELPSSVPIIFPINWRQSVGWSHPIPELTDLSCEFDINAADCSWGQTDLVLAANDRAATLDDDLLSNLWAMSSYDYFWRNLDLFNLEEQGGEAQQYYEAFPSTPLLEYARTERVIQKPYVSDFASLGDETDNRVISVPVADTVLSTSFFINVYTQAYARIGANSAGRLDVQNSFALFQSPTIDPNFADLFGLVEPLSSYQADSAGEPLEGAEDSAPSVLATLGNTALSCAYDGGLVSGTTRTTSYFLHRPGQSPIQVNPRPEQPFLCRNDQTARQSNASLPLNDGFLIFYQGGVNKAPSVKEKAGPTVYEWYRVNAQTGELLQLPIEPIMLSPAYPFAEKHLFVGGPQSGAGLFDLGIWQTDGTSAGTRVFAQARYDGTLAAGYQILHNVAEQVYFVALPDFGTSAPTGTVWRSDGSTGGPVPIQLPGQGVIWGAAPLADGLALDASVLFNRDVYFIDNATGVATPVSSWLGDQAPANGLRLLHNHPLGGLALMHDTDERAVYVTDGTPAGTYRLFSANHILGNDSLNRSALHDGFVYFALNDSDRQASTLWRTDGTPGGTQAVTTPWQDPEGTSSMFGEFKQINGFLAYVRQHFNSPGAYQSTLWLMTREDNQFRAFTNQPAVVPPIFQDGSVQDLTASADGKLYFAGRRDSSEALQSIRETDDRLNPNFPPDVQIPADWEAYFIDTNATRLKDPNYAPLAPAGPLRPLPVFGNSLLYTDSFETRN